VILVTAAGTVPLRAAARFVPITVFLAGQAFELEDIQEMSAAFVAACDALHLKISDPAARFVAEKVIALAQRGISDLTLKEFGLSDESPSVAPSKCGTVPSTPMLPVLHSLNQLGHFSRNQRLRERQTQGVGAHEQTTDRKAGRE